MKYLYFIFLPLRCLPGIKEEQELWTNHGGEKLQQVKCETTDSIFSSTGVRTHCDVDEASQAPADQTPTVNTDGDIVISNITSLQIKMESAEEDNGATVSGEAEIKTEQPGKSDELT